MWNFGAGGKGKKQDRDWITEGKVDVFMFKNEPQKVRLLLEDIDPEVYAKENKITVEEAMEIIFSKLMHEKWLQPYPIWEHTIPQIRGERFFSVTICRGISQCELCAQNDFDRNNGVSENRDLSFPVKRTFIVPVWVYGLNRVLFVRQSQKFFEGLLPYIKKNGLSIDFEFSKAGVGLNTTYSAIFVGPAELKEFDFSKITKPCELDFNISDEDLAIRLGKKKKAPVQQQTQQQVTTTTSSVVQEPVSTDNPGDCTVPFGTYKGHKISEIFELNTDYLTFLAEKGSGIIQKSAAEFLKAKNVGK